MNLLFKVEGVFRWCRYPAGDEFFELRRLTVEQGKVLQFPGRDGGSSAESCKQKVYELGIEQAQNVEERNGSPCPGSDIDIVDVVFHEEQWVSREKVV